MTEDFTSTNQKVVNQLIQLEKDKLIKKFWSNDEKVYAKVVDEQSKFRIKSKSNITDLFQNVVEEDFINENEAEAVTQQLEGSIETIVDESVPLF